MNISMNTTPSYPQAQPAQPQPLSAIFQPSIIVTQPIGISAGIGGWMMAPAVSVPNCPRGLEYLTQVDQLLVQQKVEIAEELIGFETNNKYAIKNAFGQTVYWAIEETDCCTRNCCGSIRPFQIKVLDASRTEVIRMSRPLGCGSCCFPCCLQTMEVSSPTGYVFGKIEQQWTLFASNFVIRDQSGDSVLRIEGPCLTASFCCRDVDFNIVSLDGKKVGKISKQRSSLAKESATETDNFGIHFPMDLDPKMKAVMLGVCLLIDFMFYEKRFPAATDVSSYFFV